MLRAQAGVPEQSVMASVAGRVEVNASAAHSTFFREAFTPRAWVSVPFTLPLSFSQSQDINSSKSHNQCVKPYEDDKDKLV